MADAGGGSCAPQIKRVLRIARGMVGGRVERVEAMIFVLDLRPVGDGETDFAERADDVVGDLRERMQFAERAAASGQGEIGRLLRQRGFEFQFLAARRQRGFQFDFGGVDEFAGGGLFLLGERAELFHQGGEFAVRPDPRALGLFQRGEVGRGFAIPPARFVSAVRCRSGISHNGKNLAAKRRKRHKEISILASRILCHLAASIHYKRKTGGHRWTPVNCKFEI